MPAQNVETAAPGRSPPSVKEILRLAHGADELRASRALSGVLCRSSMGEHDAVGTRFSKHKGLALSGRGQFLLRDALGLVSFSVGKVLQCEHGRGVFLFSKVYYNASSRSSS